MKAATCASSDKKKADASIEAPTEMLYQRPLRTLGTILAKDYPCRLRAVKDRQQD